jgi:guanylate cyclase soluble subunit beta
MYGVVNRSLKELILIHHGEERWQKVLELSKVPGDSFLSMQSYDDQVTYDLAQAVAAELAISVDDALRAFGVHWVEHTMVHHYDALARAAGSNLLQFLENLNVLHDRISSTFLEYRPPRFDIQHLSHNRVEVLYSSQRVGLTPFVEGLLEGLSKRFNEPIDILSIESLPTQSGTHSRFEMRLIESRNG